MKVSPGDQVIRITADEILSLLLVHSLHVPSYRSEVIDTLTSILVQERLTIR